MFWSYSQTSSPQIDNVICKEDLTLQELFDQDNILQELKSQNKKLIDFLVKPEVLSELVSLITTEPSEDIPEQERFKHANTACELLTTDIPSLTENLAKDASLLSKLYSFLECDPPLNALLASFFSRTMTALISRKTEQNWYSYQFTCLQVLEFLKNRDDSISLLLRHLGTSAIMDLVFKLVTQIECLEMKKVILNYMDAQGLVANLVELLAPSAGAQVNCNAAALLCDILVRSREAQTNSETHPVPDPVLTTLESCETVKRLLDVILAGEKKESSIVGGISVLLILLEPSKPSGEGPVVANYSSDGGGEGEVQTPPPSPPPPITTITIEAILPHLPAFHNLLLEPPYKPSVKLTCGTVDPPVGNTRLQVVRLLAALIATAHPQVHEQLVALDTIQVLLDLFFRYDWNNFLHTQVEKCLNKAIAVEPLPTDSVLIHNIFVKCRLLQKIVDAWNENEVSQRRVGGCRKGYMGHLTMISLLISSHKVDKSLSQFLKANLPEDQLNVWREFTGGTLRHIENQRGTCLGGKHPNQSSSDDDEKNFRNIPFQQDPQLQQLYTEYQTQQTAPQFVENFGYNENEFNDSEDTMNPAVDPEVGFFSIADDDNDMEKQADLFKKVCAQKLQCLDSEDDIWSDNNQISRIWNGGDGIGHYNSSDDDEKPGPEGKEQIDDPWSSVGAPVMDSPANPWGSTTVEVSGDSEGWATFDNFNADFPPLSDPTPSLNAMDAIPVSPSESLEASSDLTTDISDDVFVTKDAYDSASSNKVTTVNEQELIDNFRFLSTQGLMSEPTENTTPQPPDSSGDTGSSEMPVDLSTPAAEPTIANSVPAEASLLTSTPVESTTSQCTPTAKPLESSLPEPTPTEPTLPESSSTEPEAFASSPSECTPSEPTLPEPSSTELKPFESLLSEPTPTEHALPESSPTEPNPVSSASENAPAELTSHNPTPPECTPVEPAPASLISPPTV